MANDIPDELRAAVAQRADGREYGLIREQDAGFSHQIDHIVSRKHGGPSTLENLASACVLCNRYKGPDIASSREHEKPHLVTLKSCLLASYRPKARKNFKRVLGSRGLKNRIV